MPSRMPLKEARSMRLLKITSVNPSANNPGPHNTPMSVTIRTTATTSQHNCDNCCARDNTSERYVAYLRAGKRKPGSMSKNQSQEGRQCIPSVRTNRRRGGSIYAPD
eukprot:4298772-Pyramimonas_sp.AAC.1